MTNALDVSGARLESVLNTAVDGIVVIDEQARILMFNRACESLFGYKAEEVMGRNVKCIMPDSYASEHDQYMHNYLSTGTRKIIGIGREVSARHRDGTVFPIDLSVGEAETADGRQFIGIIRDLRARQENERRLKDLQGQIVHIARLSAIDEMGAALAHELNQPLTAIMLYLQAIDRSFQKEGQAPDLRRITEILQKAVHEADRAGGIIHRLRQFVERKETDRSFQDMRMLVDDAVELASLGASSRGIAVRMDHPEEPVTVLVDPIQIQQIVINLVRNAVDALVAVPDGIITISTRREGHATVTRVTDNGPGIDPGIRDALFKAFRSTKPNGLGIGLAIARTIAQNHQGELYFEDGPDGRGTTFVLRLPFEHADQDVGDETACSIRCAEHGHGDLAESLAPHPQTLDPERAG